MEVNNQPILRVEHLRKYFDAQRHVISRAKDQIKAVDDVSFTINRGSTFALVGESGCGKSTVARLLLRLITATDGKAFFNDEDLFAMSESEMRVMRRDIQMIFQDPYSSLNPRWQVRKIVAEPLDTHNIGTSAQRKEMVNDILRIVGLSEDSGNKYAHEFSGGQRQRIGIARALITNPQFIICDEPISALDVSIQAQIINLLRDLQQQYSLTYLFITHDLRIVKFLCDQTAVMYLGKLVETGSTREIFAKPTHPYTKALFSAIPIPDPYYEKQEEPIEGDVPSPLNPPSGCRFHTRCIYAKPICSEQEPPLTEIAPNHSCACHLLSEF
ncbi:MAG: ABC transporter ATP-binding protein [Clostridiaceae bacterium]|jgi:oligopeptide transport system ATP-binding protein|nr:ABC transporter ATP-binding protein [Clostridiaceae bacterium]